MHNFAAGAGLELQHSRFQFVVQLISTFDKATHQAPGTNSQSDQTANCSYYLIKPPIIAQLGLTYIIPQLPTPEFKEPTKLAVS